MPPGLFFIQRNDSVSRNQQETSYFWGPRSNVGDIPIVNILQPFGEDQRLTGTYARQQLSATSLPSQEAPSQRKYPKSAPIPIIKRRNQLPASASLGSVLSSPPETFWQSSRSLPVAFLQSPVVSSSSSLWAVFQQSFPWTYSTTSLYFRAINRPMLAKLEKPFTKRTHCQTTTKKGGHTQGKRQ